MAVARQPRLGVWLGKLSLLSAGKPKQTVTWILVMSAIVGSGMFQLETDSDLLKILPKDDPHTHAAQRASHEFRGFYDFVTFFYAVDPAKCEALTPEKLPYHYPQYMPDREGNEVEVTCQNVLHESYVRGIDEIWQFLQAEIPQAVYAIDFAMLIKTINWTNDGFFGDTPHESLLLPLLQGDTQRVGRPPDDDAFQMPGTDPLGSFQFAAAFRGILAADEAATDSVSPDLASGRTLIFFDTTKDLSRVELGRAVYAAVDKYQAAIRACDDNVPETPCELEWNLFKAEEGLAVRGVSTLDAHASDVTKRDISKLAPIIIWAIVAILYIAFRDPRVILVSAANLFIAFVWTAGLMGWLHIPFSALNMTIVPLILGVGIDYGIHMVSEFLEHKSDGMGNAEAFQQAGVRAGLAMGIATITTVLGLLLMIFSPSILMAQLGIVSSIALLVTFIFTLTFVPALLTLTTKEGVRRRAHKGSNATLALARFIGRHRVVSLLVVLVISGAAAASMRNLEPEPFGNPELNYPPGDRVRDDSQTISDLFFAGDTDTQTNYLIVEGDFTDPATHAFLDDLERRLQEHPEIEGFNTASLTRVVRGWTAVNQGTPKAVVSQFILQNPNQPNQDLRDAEYPKTQEEMKALLDDIFDSPMANLMTVLLAPETYNIGMVAYDTKQDLAYADVQRVWYATEEVILATQAAHPGVEVQAHQFGNNAFSYLFIEKEQPWVNTIGIVAFGLVIVMIGLLTRNVRATAATAAVMGATSIWWLGLLPVMGVGLSVGLMLPMVFIMAIGSDDAIHLIWNMELTSNRARVYRFVGQAVLLTSVTTLVAFSLFSFQTDLLVRRTLLATAAATVVMWISTMLIVPAFYPPPPEEPPTSPTPTTPVAELVTKTRGHDATKIYAR